jgi:hypothetical protein
MASETVESMQVRAVVRIISERTTVQREHTGKSCSPCYDIRETSWPETEESMQSKLWSYHDNRKTNWAGTHCNKSQSVFTLADSDVTIDFIKATSLLIKYPCLKINEEGTQPEHT